MHSRHDNECWSRPKSTELLFMALKSKVVLETCKYFYLREKLSKSRDENGLIHPSTVHWRFSIKLFSDWNFHYSLLYLSTAASKWFNRFHWDQVVEGNWISGQLKVYPWLTDQCYSHFVCNIIIIISDSCIPFHILEIIIVLISHAADECGCKSTTSH